MRGRQRILIRTSGSVTYTVAEGTDPLSLSVDVVGATIESSAARTVDLRQATSPISRLVASQHQTAPDPIVRVAADLRGPTRYDVRQTATGIVVEFLNAPRTAAAPPRRFVGRLCREKPAPGFDTVAVCLISDRAMIELNRRFRGREGTTDVLSFPGDETPAPSGPRHLGDILISVPQAERQAREAKHAVGREIRILTTHGWLHLLGYDHETDDGAMSRLQQRLLRKLLPRSASS